MPTALMPEGRQRYYNNDGTPCAGGFVYTYDAGTTNPRVTYADEAGTTPNPNPVPLDAHGEAVIYWSGAYKVDVKQADGTQVTGYPVDNLKTDPAGLWGLVALLLTAAGAAMIGFIQAGAGAVLRTVQDKFRERVSVLDYYKAATDNGDYTAAIQRAHDALPNAGGVIEFPPGTEYNLAVDGAYVNITKPNVTLYGPGAWVVSPNSLDAEVRTGNRYLNGFKVTADGCVVRVNMRGPAVAWYPGAATDRLAARNMEFRNMYNSGIAIAGNLGFDLLDVWGVTFNTSRDLISDAGNYEAISRSSKSTDPAGRLVRVNRSLFRGVSGGLDVHNVAETMVGGGTRFEGCDITCIKMSTADTLPVNQNLTVDATVSFDGVAINSASANRHLACTGSRTVAGYTMYMGFIQVFDNVQWYGKARNFQNLGVSFLDGSYTNAVINFDRSRFENVPAAIVDPQGTFSLCHAELISSNVYGSAASILRSAKIEDNRMRGSYVALTKRATGAEARYSIRRNNIDYSVDNAAPIRLTNYGTDTGPTVVIDENNIAVSGVGVTLAIDGGTSGTKAFIGANNVLSAGATVNGAYMPNYEYATTSGYVGSLFLPLRNGELTLVNTNAAGQIIYDLQDAVSSKLPIGTIFHFCKTNNTNPLYFSMSLSVSGSGGINGYNSARADTAYASATFKKIGANRWIMTAQSGTWTMA